MRPQWLGGVNTLLSVSTELAGISRHAEHSPPPAGALTAFPSQEQKSPFFQCTWGVLGAGPYAAPHNKGGRIQISWNASPDHATLKSEINGSNCLKTPN